MSNKVLKTHQKINGNHIYYEYYKKDPSEFTLLFIHGFLSSTFSFRHLIPLLQEEYSIISVDLPPFGKSGKSNHYTYSLENTARTVIQLIDILGIENVAVVGHSMGGQVSLNMAHMRPDLVQKAVLLSSSGYLKRSKQSLILSSYIPFFPYFIKRQLARTGVMKNLENVVYDHSLIDDEMYNGYLMPFLKNDIFKALTRMLRHHEGDLPQQVLHQIETPCLLIWGEHDKVVPLQIGKRLNADLKHSELIVLKETGHLVPEERPLDVKRHIMGFLSEKALSPSSTKTLGHGDRFRVPVGLTGTQNLPPHPTT